MHIGMAVQDLHVIARQAYSEVEEDYNGITCTQPIGLHINKW